MREPILRSAFWPSVARILGFCRTLVSESESKRLAVAWPTVTAKLVALRWARLFNVRLVDVVPVVVVPVVVVDVVPVVPVVPVVLVAFGGCNCRPKLPGS